MTTSVDVVSVKWISTSPESDRFHQRYAKAGVTLIVAGVVIIGTACWAFVYAFLGAGGTPWFLWVGIGLFLVCLAVRAILFGQRHRRGALSAVGVTGDGITLKWASDVLTTLRWEDPAFDLKLQDMRGYRPAGALVSTLTVNGRAGGLNTEALDAILAAAASQGMEIKSNPWKGSWGEVGRYEIRRRRPSPS